MPQFRVRCVQPHSNGFDTVRKNPRLFRLAATVALTALLCDVVVPPSAVAQSAPPPPPLPAPGEGRPDLNQADPPERVGRIASMTGSVSFHNLGDTQWSAATLNYPVSSGNSFWTEPSSESQLEVSACRIAMAGGTEFDVAALDGNGLQGVAAQGEIYVHLHDLAPNEVWSIQTPRGLVRLSGEGRYDIVVGTTDQPTQVTVVEGAAQVGGPGVSLQAAASQTATITGTEHLPGQCWPGGAGCFPDRPAGRRTTAARPRGRRPGPGGLCHGRRQRSGRDRKLEPGAGIRPGLVSARRRHLGALSRGPLGLMSRPGAGPGSTMRPGASRRSITGAGFRSAAAGAGHRVRLPWPDRRSTRRRW